eukprot:m51a1_g165 hypothetical protein (273) ;mRNA; r:534567-535634
MAEKRIPGYGGHVMGERDSFGSTYGNTTGVLASGGSSIEGQNISSAGDDRRQFIVGYTGHIPLAREMIAKPYKEQAQAAFATHDRLCEQHQRATTSGSISAHLRATIARGRSLPPISRDSEVSAEQMQCESTVDECKKIPGYTGFVPLYRDQSLGRRYGAATGEATQIARLPSAERTGRVRQRVSNAAATIQSSGDGTSPLPGFTGHVPGKRDVLGHTYAESASVALRDFVKEQRKKHADELRALSPGTRKVKKEERDVLILTPKKNVPVAE